MQSSSRRGNRVEPSAEPGRSEEAEPTPRPQGPLDLARRMSTLALAVGLTALAIAIVAPVLTPRGPTVATASRGGVVLIASTCTHYPGAEVAIATSGPGTVVVSATVGVGVGHTFGTADEVRIVLSASSTDCTVSNSTAFVSVPPTMATDALHYETVPLLRAFPVAGRGSITVYVNGVMASGADAIDRFDSASLAAVFYPT